MFYHSTVAGSQKCLIYKATSNFSVHDSSSSSVGFILNSVYVCVCVFAIHIVIGCLIGILEYRVANILGGKRIVY